MAGEPEIARALRQAGLRLTPQRYDVLAFLAARRVHATADEIFQAVNRAHPRLSRATVYNTLRALVRSGLVRELAGDGAAARFDARLQRHHHFVCDGCGGIEDVEWFELPPALRQRGWGGGTVREIEVIFRGSCRQCAGGARRGGATGS